MTVNLSIRLSRLTILLLLCGAITFFSVTDGFTQVSRRTSLRSVPAFFSPQTILQLSSKADDVCTVQILMSDTGGGHRASANALKDALDVLHPGKFECDIVDLYTDYGNIWPYTDYPALYKFMAKYPFLWDAFYRFGETAFGMWLNAFLLEIFCFDSFRECLNRPSGSTSKRADMVISVHPLCQDIPLKALANLDSNGETRDPKARTTPFVTVVTDLGGVSCVFLGHFIIINMVAFVNLLTLSRRPRQAHPTWFNPG